VVEPAISQQGVQIFACFPIADVVHPREVVETGSFDIKVLITSFRHGEKFNLIIVIGVYVEALRNGHPIAV
jgi:hypothetical protein